MPPVCIDDMVDDAMPTSFCVGGTPGISRPYNFVLLNSLALKWGLRAPYLPQSGNAPGLACSREGVGLGDGLTHPSGNECFDHATRPELGPLHLLCHILWHW